MKRLWIAGIALLSISILPSGLMARSHHRPDPAPPPRLLTFDHL